MPSLAGAAIGLHTDTYVGHLQIIGNTGGVVVGSRGIEANGGTTSDTWVAHWTIDNVHISFVEDGIYLENTWSSDILTPYITACTNSLHISGTDADQANSIDVYGGEFHGSTANGVLVDAIVVTGLNFYGGTNEGHTGYGIKLGDSSSGIRGVLVSGVYFEANGLGDIYATSGGAGVESLSIENTRHFNFTDAIKLDKCDKGHITGARFQRASFTTQKPITLGASCSYVRVDDCRYRPTGQLVFNQADDDSGKQNTADNTPRPWNVSGDGVTDVTTELQAWLAANPKHAHLPAGTYIVSGTLTVSQDQLLTGDGMVQSVIRPASGFLGPVLEVGFRSQVRDVGVQGRDEATSIGIEPVGTGDQWLIERVQIRNFDFGLKVDNQNTDCTIRDCLIRLNAAAGILCSSASGVPERLTVENNVFDANGIGFHASGALRALTLRSNAFINGTTYGVYLEGQCQAADISGNRASTNGTADFRLAGVSRTLSVRGNRCDGTPTSFLLACFSSTFENNTLNPSGMTPATFTVGSSADNEFGWNHAVTGDAPGPALVTGTRNTYLGKFYGVAAPISGTWIKGETVLNLDTSTDISVPLGWNCTTGGGAGVFEFAPFYRASAAIIGTATWDPGSLDNGQSVSTTVTVAGAAVGDVAIATHSQNLPNGFVLFAQVVSPTQVDVTLANVGGGTQDVGSGTLTVKVLR